MTEVESKISEVTEEQAQKILEDKENVDIQDGSDDDAVPELENGASGDGPQVQVNKQSRQEKKGAQVYLQTWPEASNWSNPRGHSQV